MQWGWGGVVWLLQSKILGVGRSEAWGGAGGALQAVLGAPKIVEKHAHNPCAIDPWLFKTPFSKAHNFGILQLLGGKGVGLPKSVNWDMEFKNHVLVVLAVRNILRHTNGYACV